MKKYICLIIFASSCIRSQAQIHIGPEVGVNMAILKYKVSGISFDQTMKAGVRAGIVADIAWGNFSFQPGILYSAKGGKVAYDIVWGNTINTNIDTRLNYLEIPLLLQYKFAAGPGKLFAGGGPTGSIALSGAETTDIHDTAYVNHHIKVNLKFGNERMYRSIDIGLMLNLGYEFDRGIVIRPFANIGLMNITNNLPSSPESLKNRAWGLSVAYLFGKK